MKRDLIVRLLVDEYWSRPTLDYWLDKETNLVRMRSPKDDYLSFLKSQAQNSATKGHRAYKLAVKEIESAA